MLGMIIGVVALVYAAVAVLNVAIVILGSVFSGAAALLGGVFSMKKVVIGIVIGYLAVRYLRNRNTNMAQNG